ncbi:hypothetical protein BCV70DRAFT_200087 [Testicularia cyperi]|uniref:Dynactin subunit 4 n=1 Tax=Testicularia cyperi TaxID=1882483 RepID=A0A317XU38_9BASI|nr:hypothetical protein BCV70DRAFT_200087 [Testicularia cyperi]
MQPYVLYHCPCEQSSSGSSAAQPTATAATTPSSALSPSPSVSAAAVASSSSVPPELPAYSPAARYAFHQLESLYFCDECDQIRCNRCVTFDISSYYCPNCLFEVPGASVKAEKNRCARNCFICPCCTHTLSVLASDLNSIDADGLHLTSPATSQGEPPYYLGCSFCKWDSKSIGLTFEKPTGLSLQLQRQEDNAPDVIEFERLKDHFDPYLRVQTQAAAASAAIGSGSSSSKHGSAANSSASGGAGKPTAGSSSSKITRAHAANEAASAALKNSKLLRDLPSLASSKYMSSLAGLHDPARIGRVEREELKPYEALTSWTAGRTSSPRPSSSSPSSSAGANGPSASEALGVMGRRERYRRDYVAKATVVEGTPSASTDDKMSSLTQRWTAPWDQPVRAAELRPTRVPLRAKHSKRCPACRHIIIKPDIKAASNRFKIKLVATNFLPEVQVGVAPQQPFLTVSSVDVGGGAGLAGGGSGAMGAAGGSGGAAAAAGTLRRRPFSTLGASSTVGSSVAAGVGSMGTAAGSSFLSASSILSANDVDTARLLPGQTYTFQLKITNPLDEALRVKIAFVRVGTGPFPPAGGGAVPDLLSEVKYIFSSSKEETAQGSDRDVGAMADDMQTVSLDRAPGGQGVDVEGDGKKSRSRRPWKLYPSTTAFPLSAYNEVWELEDPEDLLSGDKGSLDDGAADADDDDDDDEADGVRQDDDSEFSDVQDDEDGDGVAAAAETEQGGGAGAGAGARGPGEEAQADRVTTTRPSRSRPSLLRDDPFNTRPPSTRRTPRTATASTTNRLPKRKKFIQKGHSTAIFLDLAIAAKQPPPPPPSPAAAAAAATGSDETSQSQIQVAMHVTYSYVNSDDAAATATKDDSKHQQRDFSFWTALHLGTIAPPLPPSTAAST